MTAKRPRWRQSWMRRHADRTCLIADQSGRWIAVRGGTVLEQGKAQDLDLAMRAASDAFPYDDANWEPQTYAVPAEGIRLTVEEPRLHEVMWAVRVWDRLVCTGRARDQREGKIAATKAFRGCVS